MYNSQSCLWEEQPFSREELAAAAFLLQEKALVVALGSGFFFVGTGDDFLTEAGSHPARQHGYSYNKNHSQAARRPLECEDRFAVSPNL
jgi:hypothetical protein